jgi:hypothetical protein
MAVRAPRHARGHGIDWRVVEADLEHPRKLQLPIAVGQRAGAEAGTWQIADNSAHFQTQDVGLIRQPGGVKVWHTELLSLDRADRNYLRFPADAPLLLEDEAGLPHWIGALAPGPAPDEGDWFTRVLQR